MLSILAGPCCDPGAEAARNAAGLGQSWVPNDAHGGCGDGPENVGPGGPLGSVGRVVVAGACQGDGEDAEELDAVVVVGEEVAVVGG